MFVFLGFGYTAKYIARLLPDNLSYKSSSRVSSANTFQYTAGEGLPDFINKATHLLVSIPPTEAGDQVISDLKCLLLKNLKWIGYFSTTGVYGNHKGAWVDEATSLNPTSERAKRRVLAEHQWLNSRLPVHIFRLSGIYGPRRNIIESWPLERIDKSGQYFSRIHVEDIARFIIASIHKPHPGSIYNVSDDEPTSTREVVEFAAELCKRDLPPLMPFETATLTEMGREFYADNKRVSNIKIKSELGMKLLFPTYREGLLNIWQGLQNYSKVVTHDQ